LFHDKKEDLSGKGKGISSRFASFLQFYTFVEISTFLKINDFETAGPAKTGGFFAPVCLIPGGIPGPDPHRHL
jgi:hypothetical protein